MPPSPVQHRHSSGSSSSSSHSLLSLPEARVVTPWLDIEKWSELLIMRPAALWPFFAAFKAKHSLLARKENEKHITYTPRNDPLMIYQTHSTAVVVQQYVNSVPSSGKHRKNKHMPPLLAAQQQVRIPARTVPPYRPCCRTLHLDVPPSKCTIIQHAVGTRNAAGLTRFS